MPAERGPPATASPDMRPTKTVCAPLHCWRPRAWATLLGLSPALSGVATGTALSSEISVGVQSGYNSNPNLVPVVDQTGSQETESIAALANLPVTYSTDTSTFDLVPRVRLGQTRGVIGLLSDYQYLDGDWQLKGERNGLAVTAGWHRDSTFYSPFENAALQGNSIHRAENKADLNWKHLLSERSDFRLVASWEKVDYSQAAATGVTDYSYAQGAGQYEWLAGERWLWTSTAGFARFQYPNGTYRSDTRFLQTSMHGQLSERWTVTARAGYTGVNSDLKVPKYRLVPGPDGVLQLVRVLVDVPSSHGSGDFSLRFEHKGQRLALDLSASQSMQPSGLGDLVTQDDLTFEANIPWTERLTLGATLRGLRISDSSDGPAAIGIRTYYNGDLSANWLISERWVLRLDGGYQAYKFSAQAPLGHAVAVNLSLSRQFRL
jgi:hypothetical protein